MQKGNSQLNIIDYELSVHIGISAQEREMKQKVFVSIMINFKSLPRATITDNVNDTLCYHNICYKLKLLNDKVFSTIEYLCHQVYNLLYEIIEPNYFQFEVRKFPVIENLKGGVKFILANNTNNYEK